MVIPKEQNKNIYQIYKQLQTVNPSKMSTTLGANYPVSYQASFILKPSVSASSVGRFPVTTTPQYVVVLGFAYQAQYWTAFPSLQPINAARGFYRFGQSIVDQTKYWYTYASVGGGDIVWGISLPIAQGKIFKTMSFAFTQFNIPGFSSIDKYDNIKVYALADKQDANGNWVSGDTWVNVGGMVNITGPAENIIVLNFLPVRASTFIIHAYAPKNTIYAGMTNLSFTYDD